MLALDGLTNEKLEKLENTLNAEERAKLPKRLQTVLAIAMIETQQALDNLDAIMSVPGLDGVYVGPSDLGISLGFPPGFDPAEPKLIDAFGKIADAAKRHKIFAGIHCGSVAYGLKMKDRGYQFITILGEMRLMAWAAKNATTAFRAGAPNPNAP